MFKIKKQNIYLLIILLFLLVISFLIIKDFLIPIIFTAILVYLFHPLYSKLIKILKSHILTSIIMIILILLIVLIPITFTIWNFSQEFSILHNEDVEQSLNELSYNLNSNYNLNLNFTQEYQTTIQNTNNYIQKSFFTKIPQALFQIFIITFLFYYFMKNYDKEYKYFKIILGEKNIKEISQKTKKLIDGIIYGQIIVRLIQAGIGTIFFIIFGIKGAVLFGVMMFFASFIPIIGTGLVWIPLAIVYLLNGEMQTSIIIVIIGLFISIIDNILLPIIISDKINIGPVITLLSIIGGLQLFGLYGIILGPFFLGLFFVFLEEFMVKLKEDNPSLKRYVWSNDERERFSKLKTDIGRKQYAEMLYKKYAKEEIDGRKIRYRLINNKYLEDN